MGLYRSRFVENGGSSWCENVFEIAPGSFYVARRVRGVICTLRRNLQTRAGIGYLARRRSRLESGHTKRYSKSFSFKVQLDA